VWMLDVHTEPQLLQHASLSLNIKRTIQKCTGIQ
jgi:hypothetical protein